jgi:radical SAM superfamily enzyme YgiQ (UPF0313 family)
VGAAFQPRHALRLAIAAESCFRPKTGLVRHRRAQRAAIGFFMKVLLIYPYFLDRRLNVEDIQAPPMGVYYVAAALKEHGHEVEVLNWHDRGISPESIATVLREKKPQMIGFSILHANRWGGIEIARIAKRVDPGVTIVFGGVGATQLWEHFLKHFPEVDFVVLG